MKIRLKAYSDPYYPTMSRSEGSLYRDQLGREDLLLARRGFLTDLRLAIRRGDQRAVRFCDDRLILIEAVLSNHFKWRCSDQLRGLTDVAKIHDRQEQARQLRAWRNSQPDPRRRTRLHLRMQQLAERWQQQKKTRRKPRRK